MAQAQARAYISRVGRKGAELAEKQIAGQFDPKAKPQTWRDKMQDSQLSDVVAATVKDLVANSYDQTPLADGTRAVKPFLKSIGFKDESI